MSRAGVDFWSGRKATTAEVGGRSLEDFREGRATRAKERMHSARSALSNERTERRDEERNLVLLFTVLFSPTPRDLDADCVYQILNQRIKCPYALRVYMFCPPSLRRSSSIRDFRNHYAQYILRKEETVAKSRGETCFRSVRFSFRAGSFYDFLMVLRW